MCLGGRSGGGECAFPLGLLVGKARKGSQPLTTKYNSHSCYLSGCFVY